MGMTIDESMENLHAIQAYYNDGTQDGYIGFAKEDNESVDVAISTMRKYQKIEEVMGLHKEGKILYPRDVVGLIRKVIEDGKID